MNYEIRNLIDKGGFGEVYDCVDAVGNVYAIKIPKIEEQEEEKRFNREIRIHAALCHENILPIIEDGSYKGHPYYIMPIANCNLDNLIKNIDTLDLFSQIASGMIYAHENGVIHRDLTPRNILAFKKNGGYILKICDFGLGKFSIRDSTVITGSADSFGTVGYMAPEQRGGVRDVDHRADIYALGKILYKIVSGTEDVITINNDKIPSEFRYIINKACADDVESRFNSVKDMMEDFNLVTSPFHVSNPSHIVRDEITNILDENNFSLERTADLAKMILENTSDNIIINEIVPKIPESILKSLLNNHYDTFYFVIKDYDNSIDIIGLPFGYCDIIADFYKNLYDNTDSYELKELIIKRLPKLGYENNRYHVGYVFGQIVNELTDDSLILTVRDILSSDEQMANFCKDYFSKGIPKIISSIL
ncbi:serine/threonine-protein kinase [Methanobacterium alcaliphilum]|uniref:serine/threonine-protein kinase n=1 Tax=Methanobacterium alcaliphilum TaxID=392018 RepID=UPI00200B4836|nr:serine/threonine-protein kinase [Methanobacterium alcaliphilum]MCK9150477.1 serine/threonine protein kinase [Methanobacterium alcaliphilum]